MPAELYLRHLGQVRPLQAAVRKLGAQDPASVAAAVEFVLEGLHQNSILSRERRGGKMERVARGILDHVDRIEQAPVCPC